MSLSVAAGLTKDRDEAVLLSREISNYLMNIGPALDMAQIKVGETRDKMVPQETLYGLVRGIKWYPKRPRTPSSSWIGKQKMSATSQLIEDLIIDKRNLDRLQNTFDLNRTSTSDFIEQRDRVDELTRKLDFEEMGGRTERMQAAMCNVEFLSIAAGSTKDRDESVRLLDRISDYLSDTESSLKKAQIKFGEVRGVLDKQLAS